MYDAERGRRTKKQRGETDGDSLRETHSEREQGSDGKKHTRRRERKRFCEDKSANIFLADK